MAVEDQSQPEEPERNQGAVPVAKSGIPNSGCLPRLPGDPPRGWELVWRSVCGLGKRNRTGSRENENTKTTGDCSESLLIREIESATVKGCLTPRTELVEKKRKKRDSNKCWQGCGETGTLPHGWWEPG